MRWKTVDLVPMPTRHPLRESVALQSNTGTSRNASGEQSPENWTTQATVRAAIEPQSGEESPGSGQVGSTLSHRVTIRYYAGLTTTWRLLWGARVLHIRSVLTPGEIPQWMVLDCVEVTT